MKHLLFLISFVLIVQVTQAQDIDIKEQDFKHTIELGISDPIIYVLMNLDWNAKPNFTWSDIINTLPNASPYRSYNTSNGKSSVFPLIKNLNYWYTLSERFELGGSFSFLHWRNNRTFINRNNPDDVINAYINETIYYFQINGRFTYFQSRNFKFYGSLGIGFRLMHEKGGIKNEGRTHSFIHPGFSAFCKPIGIAFGKKFGVYLELGEGYTGFLETGLFYKF